LRISPETTAAVHAQLERIFEERIFEEQKTETLSRAFCVVEPGRYRVRLLSGSG